MFHFSRTMLGKSTSHKSAAICLDQYHCLCSYAIYYSTTENVAIFIWDQLKEALKSKADLLYEVCVHETDSNVITYRGE